MHMQHFTVTAICKPVVGCQARCFLVLSVRGAWRAIGATLCTAVLNVRGLLTVFVHNPLDTSDF
jgi:hypothetical protein